MIYLNYLLSGWTRAKVLYLCLGAGFPNCFGTVSTKSGLLLNLSYITPGGLSNFNVKGGEVTTIGFSITYSTFV